MEYHGDNGEISTIRIITSSTDRHSSTGRQPSYGKASSRCQLQIQNLWLRQGAYASRSDSTASHDLGAGHRRDSRMPGAGSSGTAGPSGGRRLGTGVAHVM